MQRSKKRKLAAEKAGRAVTNRPSLAETQDALFALGHVVNQNAAMTNAILYSLQAAGIRLQRPPSIPTVGASQSGAALDRPATKPCGGCGAEGVVRDDNNRKVTCPRCQGLCVEPAAPESTEETANAPAA